MKIASVADVKAKFSGYLKASEQGPVVVTKNGRPVAMLLSITDEDKIERMVLAHSPKFQSILNVPILPPKRSFYVNTQAASQSIFRFDQMWHITYRDHHLDRSRQFY